MKKYNNFIIAPHIDDEVLGCFSFMRPDTFICILGVEDRSYVSAKDRCNELKESARMNNFSWKVHTNIVNNYQVPDLIPILEWHINKIKPSCVIIPHYSYNQDHRAVYDASLVALRPHDKNWFVKKVLIYEQPDTFLWPYTTFSPTYFLDINIKEKLKAYHLYKSQIRGHRSDEIIKTIARARGMQSNMEYAEAFQCLRWVDSK
jgi:LmbE family N-acetylglucosaminyl deacetylase